MALFIRQRLVVVGAALAVCLRGSAVQAVTLTTLASFNGANGATPEARLIADANGNLYGTTSSGGANRYGTIFKLDPDAGVLTTLVSFNRDDGAYPHAGLIADAVGNLYGTTTGGGANGYGTIFKLDADAGVLTTLVSFNNADGASPYAGLIADTTGNLYGTTSRGGQNGYGTIFKLDPAAGVLTTLVSFNRADGSYPYADLIADTAGNLYGTTVGGGANDVGTVFKFDSADGVLTTLASLSRAHGESPFAGLTADAAGNLYGTAFLGGANGNGTIFKLDQATGVLTTLASFSHADGYYPSAGLIADAAGNLYGTTNGGQTRGPGTVFKFDRTAGVITKLVAFNVANGEWPNAGLIADAAGNLYGTTSRGGPSPYGTVFKLSDTGFVVFVPEPGAGLLATLAFVSVSLQRRRKSRNRVAIQAISHMRA